MTEYLTEWSQTFWHYLLVLCLHIRFRNGLKHMTECPHIFFRYFLLCLHMSISKAPKRMTNTHKDLVAWLMHNPPICFAFLVFWGWLLSAGGPFWDPVWAHGCLFEVSWGPYAHFTSFQGPFCEAKGPSRLHTERNLAHLGVPWRPKWNSWGHQADIAKTYKNKWFLMVFEGWRLTVDLHFWSLSSLHVSFEVPGGNLNHCLDAGWPGGRPEGPQNPDDHPGWGLVCCCRGPNHPSPDHKRQIANSKM